MLCRGTLENLVQTFSRRFLPHMSNAAGGSPLRHVYKSSKSFRWGAGAAGGGRSIHIYSAVEITCFCLQYIDSYHKRLSWHLCRCLLDVWHCFFMQRYLFSFVVFFFGQLEMSSPHSPAMDPAEDLMLLSHIGSSWVSADTTLQILFFLNCLNQILIPVSLFSKGMHSPTAFWLTELLSSVNHKARPWPVVDGAGPSKSVTLCMLVTSGECVFAAQSPCRVLSCLIIGKIFWT